VAEEHAERCEGIRQQLAQRAGVSERARELERLLDLALDAEPLARAAGSH